MDDQLSVTLTGTSNDEASAGILAQAAALDGARAQLIPGETTKYRVSVVIDDGDTEAIAIADALKDAFNELITDAAESSTSGSDVTYTWEARTVSGWCNVS